MSGAAVAIAGAQFIPGVDVIVDVGLAVAAVGLGAAVLWEAHKKSQSQLKDSPQVEACADCGDGPDCFEPPDRNDPEKLAEFRRQLKGQQDGINKLTPDQVMNNIDRYAKDGRGAYPGEAADRRMFRGTQWNKAYNKALDGYSQDPNTAAEADTLAGQAADNALSGKAALHNPDMVAGGNPAATDLGDAGANSSLGSQWAKTRSGSKLSRAQQLRKAAEKAKQAGKTKMDVNLNEC